MLPVLTWARISEKDRANTKPMNSRPNHKRFRELESDLINFRASQSSDFACLGTIGATYHTGLTCANQKTISVCPYDDLK
jgi:hypothetical protein